MKDAFKSLRPETKRWIGELRKKYVLESHTERTLIAAAMNWDRAASARELILKNGLTFLDRWNQVRPNPAVEIEQKALSCFARLVRESGIDLETMPESRPPRQY